MWLEGIPVFLFSETVAVPFPFLIFHLNSLTRRSSNPPPLSDDRDSGGSCGWNRSSYESRQNNSQEPRRPASHLRRNKFQRRNSETPEEEGVICYRRKRLGRRPQKKRDGGRERDIIYQKLKLYERCYNLFNAVVRIEFVN